MRIAPEICVALVLCCAATARAQEGDVAAAADAYSRAQQAELRGEWEEAAQLYALADQISPTREALRSAARAAQRAGLDATAATHAAALLARDGDDQESRALAEQILRSTERRLARIEARCEAECRVLIDGRVAASRAALEHVLYARPGDREIVASFEDGATSEPEGAALEAGGRFEFDFTRPAGPVEQDPVSTSGSSGLSPWFFAGGVLVTAVFGAVSIWSGVEVLNAHADYDRGAPDAPMRYAQGRDLETRTNVLLGITGGFALLSVVLAIFTDWDGERAETASLPLFYADGQSALFAWRAPLE
jgi:hypothetical protein